MFGIVDVNNMLTTPPLGLSIFVTCDDGTESIARVGELFLKPFVMKENDVLYATTHPVPVKHLDLRIEGAI